MQSSGKFHRYEPFALYFWADLLRDAAFDAGLLQHEIGAHFGLAGRLGDCRRHHHDRYFTRLFNPRKAGNPMSHIKIILWIEAAILSGLVLGVVVWRVLMKGGL